MAAENTNAGNLETIARQKRVVPLGDNKCRYPADYMDISAVQDLVRRNGGFQKDMRYVVELEPCGFVYSNGNSKQIIVNENAMEEQLHIPCYEVIKDKESYTITPVEKRDESAFVSLRDIIESGKIEKRKINQVSARINVKGYCVLEKEPLPLPPENAAQEACANLEPSIQPPEQDPVQEHYVHENYIHEEPVIGLVEDPQTGEFRLEEV